MSYIDGAILVFALYVIWSVYRAHRIPGNHIDLMDLLMSNGRLSKFSITYVAAMILIGWIMIKLMEQGKMTEGYLGMFGTIVLAPLVTHMLTEAKEKDSAGKTRLGSKKPAAPAEDGVTLKVEKEKPQ